VPETTRHFVATVYVVNDGAVALHHHDRLEMWLPPGGHLDRDELPHEAARRETREELGLEPELLTDVGDLSSPTVEALPEPAAFLLEDIDRVDGAVAHQHVDFVFFGRVDTRRIDPAPGEAPPEAWEWVTPAELDADGDRFEADVRELGRRAVAAVDGESG
jgi:8-oxo-dGTP pyrophosphatase MutT (NUDIX family)